MNKTDEAKLKTIEKIINVSETVTVDVKGKCFILCNIACNDCWIKSECDVYFRGVIPTLSKMEKVYFKDKFPELFI